MNDSALGEEQTADVTFDEAVRQARAAIQLVRDSKLPRTELRREGARVYEVEVGSAPECPACGRLR